VVDLNRDCEVCGRYCGNKTLKARLLVEIPEDLQEKLGKSHAWLCFKCVRKHCFETIGNILYEEDGFTPMLDSNGKVYRTNYWCKLIFGLKKAGLRYDVEPAKNEESRT